MHVFSVGNDEIWSEKEGQSQHQKQEHFLEKTIALDKTAMVCTKLLKVLNIAEVPCIKAPGPIRFVSSPKLYDHSSTTVGTRITHSPWPQKLDSHESAIHCWSPTNLLKWPVKLLELNFLRVRTTNLEKIPEHKLAHFDRRQIILIVVTSKNYSFPIPGPVRSRTPNRDLSSDWPVDS